MSDQRVLITSALPYIHGIPHLGNVITSILPADVYYRYQRLKGKNALYICASDSHGTMYEIEAEKRGVETEELVYGSHEDVKELFRRFDFDFSYYGITDSEENKKTTEHLFQRLDENGYIKEREIEVTYCENCERYLADRWIEGDCPDCGGLARGDQCDDCGRLLNPKELVDPYCIHCEGSDIDFRGSKHLFFQLQEFEDWLRGWVKGVSGNKLTEKETFSWLDTGLEERCITRDADWGFNVPKEGFEDKVFYVWFDAPIGYIGATRSWAKEKAEDWKDWWMNEEVEHVQFMGKDNIPFHTVLFPSVLKGSDEEWNLADRIMAGAWLVSTGDVKFSKSRGTGLNLESALDVKGSDYWRFVLMALYPRDNDVKFSWDIFCDKINNELIDSFGNYVHRVLKFINDNFDGEVPKVDNIDEDITEEIVDHVENIESYLDDFQFRKAMDEVIRLSSVGNRYFQENKPWETVKEDIEECEKTLYVCASIVRSLAIVSEPFMPETAERIWKYLGQETNIHEEEWDKAKEMGSDLKKVNEPETLFEKIEKDEIPEMNKQSKKESGKPGSKSGGEEKMISFDEFKELDLRIGEIKEVEAIEGADKLFKLKIDVGGEVKQSVAGMKEHYSKEDLEGKKVPVLVNLEASKLMGVKSECMVLAAVVNNKEPVLLQPERDVDAGTGVA